MTYKTDRIIPPHGGYRKLKSYQTSELVYDFTVEFCDRYVDESHKTYRAYKSRMTDQMVQAARSGKQNIVEGSKASGTSKKMELKLVGIARASMEELLQDYEDFLRQRGLSLWGKDHPGSRAVRALAYRPDRTYETYRQFLASPETAANAALCLIHQANFLLDRQLRALEKDFLENGGFTERLYHSRKSYRSNGSYGTDRPYRT